MIIILADKHDKQSDILSKVLANESINFKWIRPYDVFSFALNYIDESFIKLIDNSYISSSGHLFINRLPDLHNLHPLNLFVNTINYNNVITHPNVAATFYSKIAQLKLFDHYPNTLVMKGIKSNIRKEYPDWCVKSISQVRSFVRSANDNSFNFKGLDFMPVQFQKMACGDHIKSHMVENEIFSYKFHSNTLDPRESNYVLEYYPTCNRLSKLLIEIKKILALDYFDCDLIINSNKIILLEVNTSPALLVFDQESKAEIAKEKFVKFLINKESQISQQNSQKEF